MFGIALGIGFSTGWLIFSLCGAVFLVWFALWVLGDIARTFEQARRARREKLLTRKRRAL